MIAADGNGGGLRNLQGQETSCKEGNCNCEEWGMGVEQKLEHCSGKGEDVYGVKANEKR